MMTLFLNLRKEQKQYGERMDNFIPTMGLEVHAQVKSKSKIFCRCATDFSEKPNTNICPICMGFPGVMPSINEEVVKKAVKAGMALNCRINLRSGFARKNYFYPDLPKGYQITQFKVPVAENGFVILSNGKKIRIRRLHIEEDTGKMIHDQNEDTLIDFNRAGVPLIEIVTEPDFESSAEAVEYMNRIREILRYTEVSDANMEMGELRGEPNISVRRNMVDMLGTKTEIKNLNSLKAIEKGIDFEIERQSRLLKEGREVLSETMLYNEKKQEVIPMRKKESASEYRYFIEPDLPDLIIEEAFIESVKKEMPELPEEKRVRFIKQYNVSRIESEILSSEKSLADFFEEAIKNIKQTKRCVNFFIREIPAILNSKSIDSAELKFSASDFNELLREIDSESVNLNSAQIVLSEMSEGRGKAEEIIERMNLKQTNDDFKAMELIKEIIEENPKEVERYKKGEEKLFGVLVGLCMKKAKGSISPAAINKILKEMLK
ncbi:TPA: Asp-tRNA(Asn)/Glu-tRNA(Gln) amidotransferase GatCAB subunit B [candidate division WOR-3 bacterium]|uniref:Aspartyl/glutamyl-tRNA(Asn/Gln) amidotransferase subunit B n=1 Tax=candidate division WOR-3 bacterium TaxID=2052148 RepID=A0A350H845_UNCW3|nr:Asp-tRNA(Asn)/Glu-tRNA(Gln) amidotransferase GatCAB subunit B [candidate division WOR-3 bacterium]